MVKSSPIESIPSSFYYFQTKEAESRLPISERISNFAINALNDFNRDVKAFGDCVLPKLKVTLVFIGQTTFKLLKEVIKVIIIAYALNIFVTVVFPASEMAFKVIVLAPVIEEIVFRGFLLTGFEYAQKGYNLARDYSCGHQTTPQEIENQQVFRVRATAILFGLVHLTNPHGKIEVVVQSALAAFGGLTMGYYKEKTHSLALPILDHAANNTLATLMDESSMSEYRGLIFSAWLINLCGNYYLATRKPKTDVAAVAA